MSEERSLLDIAKAHLQSKQEGPKSEGVPTPSSPRPAVSSNQKTEDTNIDEALNALLEKANEKKGWIDIELPSRGHLNSGSEGHIRLRPFTFEDEKILRSVMGLKDGAETIKTLVQRCTEGIEYNDLLLVDKAYIIFKLREMSYGAKYPIKATCQKCTEVNELVVELDKLPVEYAEEDLEEPMEVFLPDSEVKVYVKFPRSKHEGILEDPQKLTENLWRFVERVEDHSDRTLIQKFLVKTTAKDVAFLRQEIFGSELGLQTQVRYRCIRCAADEIVDLPVNENFFSVS